MKKLRHLYLSKWFLCESEKLRFPVKQMETLKNIYPDNCEMGELMQMEHLRVFSIREAFSYPYIFRDKDILKGIMESPVMKVPGQLINSFCLQVEADVMNELASETISSLAHPRFNGFVVRNSTQSLNLKQGSYIFGDNLTQVDLIEGWIVGGIEVSALGKLRLLKFLAMRFGDRRMSMSAGSFPKLTQLKLHINNLEEWVIGEGALPSLQRLHLIDCKNLTSEVKTNLPKTLTEVKIWECVIGSGLFVAALQLPCLQQLHLYHPLLLQGSNKIMSFSTGSLPKLLQLSIQFSIVDDLEELDFGEAAIPNLQHLKLKDCPKKMKALMNLPNSLTEVEIKQKCGMSEGIIVSLGNLPLLQILKLKYIQEDLNKLSFISRSFPLLTDLSINPASEIKELEVGDGSLPNLKRLELYYCDKIPQGLDMPASVDIKCYSPFISGMKIYARPGILYSAPFIL